ncbi:MAG: hypothetical protein IJ165_12330 [Proteobacteria bacterium]|nr:hypothetical protein [Pseudomonadota bacterium]
MASNRKIKSMVTALLLVCAGTAHAQDVAFDCEPGSGVWGDKESPVLDGALCSLNGQHPDLYRLEFGTGNVSFAPVIPNTVGKLRYLSAIGKTIFYADNANVYGVERDHFKVVYRLPCPGAELLPADPYDAQHIAVLSKRETYGIHLLKVGAGGVISEEMAADLGSERPLSVAWQESRLVSLARSRVMFWPRPGSSFLARKDKDGSPVNVPVNGWLEENMRAFEISPALESGDHELDPDGLMIWNKKLKKLSYYRFSSQTPTYASINATAAIHGLGHGTKYAMGVTNDLNTVRLVARLGNFLQNRFEAKYWRLPDPQRAPIVAGQDDIAALDGGSDNRVQMIDTTEMTWRRLALIQYPSPGRIADLSNDVLVTVHSGSEAMVLWHARTGQKIASLKAETLAAKQFGKIRDVRPIGKIKRYRLITNDANQYVLFDAVTGALSDVAEYEASDWSDLPKDIAVFDGAFVVHEKNMYRLYPADESKQPEVLDIRSYKPLSARELQTHVEKWYGYCLDAENCFAPNEAEPEQKRALPEISLVDPDMSHAPSWMAWLLTLFAFAMMIGVMMWRRGAFKRSLLSGVSLTTDSVSSSDFYDSKRRRFISDRDNRYFLCTHWRSLPAVRLLLSIMLGLIVGIAVATPFFYDDSVLTFLSWIVVLGMPVTAVTWIATSWTYWNRYYLLRFGRLTEGKWLNCAQANPKILYEPEEGKTYELARYQWTRVDFVPIVIFDPARPNFALQYTGGCSHEIEPAGKFEADPKPACSFDAYRLGAVVVLLAAAIFTTQAIFQLSYPNPLSAWKLDSIANSVVSDDSSKTFTMTCLEACEADDQVCSRQCHQRQLKIVFADSGTELARDPEMTAAQFLDTYRQSVAKGREILFDSKSDCAGRSAELAAITLWPDEMAYAFWATYENPETFAAAGLEDIHASLVADYEILKQLCDEGAVCARSAASCPEPPQCAGSITQLKTQVCAFLHALMIPKIEGD